MTRINLIEPRRLHQKHLVAEYREITRVYALASAWHQRGRDTGIPPHYTMGKGHVTFFYDKLGFIRDRYVQLVEEMRRRGYTVNYPQPPEVGLPQDLFNGYVPTEEALKANLQRLAESIQKIMEGEDD